MRTCPKCQAEIQDGVRFCVVCGAGVYAAPPPSVPQGDNTYHVERTVAEQTPPAGGRTVSVEAQSRATPPTTTAQQPPGATVAQAPKMVPATDIGGSKTDINKIFETSGVCPQCFAPLKKGGVQCDECGYRLTGQYCKACGASVSDGAAVCPSCKAPAQPAAQPPQGTVVDTPGPANTPPTHFATEVVPIGGTAERVGQVSQAEPAMRGTTAVGYPPAQPPYMQQPPPIFVPVPQKKGSGGKIALVVSLLVLVLGCTGCALYYFLVYKKADTATAASDTKKETAPAAMPEPKADTPTTAAPGGAETPGGPAAEKPPDVSAESLKDQAKAYLDRNEADQAFSAIQKYVDENRGDADGYFVASRVCLRQGRVDEAANYLLTAISCAPDSGEYRLELGKVYSEQGFSDKAVAQYREAVRLTPGSEEARSLLAQEMLKAGNKMAAKTIAEQYIRPPARLPPRATRPAEPTDPYAPGPPSIPKPQEPPAALDSPYVNVVLDGSAVILPGKTATVTLSFAGNQQNFNCSANMRMDNIEKGTYPYNVTLVYMDAGTGEKDSQFHGSGVLLVRYPNQRIYVRKVGERIIVQ